MDGRINFMSIAEISINYNGGNELKPTEETITINRNDTAKRSEQKPYTHKQILYMSIVAELQKYLAIVMPLETSNFGIFPGYDSDLTWQCHADVI